MHENKTHAVYRESNAGLQLSVYESSIRMTHEFATFRLTNTAHKQRAYWYVSYGHAGNDCFRPVSCVNLWGKYNFMFELSFHLPLVVAKIRLEHDIRGR